MKRMAALATILAAAFVFAAAKTPVYVDVCSVPIGGYQDFADYSGTATAPAGFVFVGASVESNATLAAFNWAPDPANPATHLLAGVPAGQSTLDGHAFAQASTAHPVGSIDGGQIKMDHLPIATDSGDSAETLPSSAQPPLGRPFGGLEDLFHNGNADTQSFAQPFPGGQRVYGRRLVRVE